MDCLFCAIINGDIPSKKVYEDDACYAFLDINPQAPVHCLVVPKEHIPSADAITAQNVGAVSAIFTAIPKIAAELGLGSGYRIVSNVGEDGCQSVKHLHFHILDESQPASGIDADHFLALQLRERDTHIAMEGATVPIEQPFDVGGSFLMMPGDWSLDPDPAEVVNCRCWLTYS